MSGGVTPLGPDASARDVERWVTAQLQYHPSIGAVVERYAAGLGPVQLNYGSRGHEKHARAAVLYRAAQAAGHLVTWVGLDEPRDLDRWRAYEPSGVERVLGDLDTLRRAREAATDDPAATLGGPLRRATRRPSRSPAGPR